ncbi:MAG: amino acid/amide ABC transporter membrane protein 1 HAAT family [Rhodocyclaceae bacterium]|nr:MAG: amino acid/amide ABC transporter membrane protein 1 HAAT family [Rhodocyclaceae bacterium]TND01510.1 MAG: amino acid/amide ABC transporter membrane protein 1, HAAT family [Rhodocyclaceae bacterium]
MELPSLSAIGAQAVSGLTTAMLLFLVASGLSLIFGVLRLLNFAHGSFYMLGAYFAWQFNTWLQGSFWLSVLFAAIATGVLGALLERVLFRKFYDRPELMQLLFTYSIVLIVSDVVKYIWGTQQLGIRRPEMLSHSFKFGEIVLPSYNLVIIVISLAIAVGIWLLLQGTRLGKMVRAAAFDREMLSMLGVDVRMLYLLVFSAGCFLAGLAGALVAPMSAVVPGMDADIIISLFIIVVIGGLGSFWGTFLGSIIYGMVFSFGILFIPQFSLFAVALIMVVILIVKPEGLLGRENTR